MPTLISKEEFAPWEENMMLTHPERVIFWDPAIDRACMLYWELKEASLAPEYIVSEGKDIRGDEIIFKYTLNEEGPFMGVQTLSEFREKCEELLDKTDLMLSDTRTMN